MNQQTKPKKVLKIIAWILLGIFIVYGIIAILPRPKNFTLDNPMLKESDLPI